jgi:hypothetical protein
MPFFKVTSYKIKIFDLALLAAVMISLALSRPAGVEAPSGISSIRKSTDQGCSVRRLFQNQRILETMAWLGFASIRG